MKEENPTMRISVTRFAQAMQRVLDENDDKPGWQNATFAYLFKQLKKETKELQNAVAEGLFLNPPAFVEKVQKEAVDVANFAMFIFDNLESLKRQFEIDPENPQQR